MLRNRGIRTKLLAVLALPIVVLMIGAAVIATQGFVQASKAGKVEQLANGANGLGDLVRRLHQERQLSLQVVANQANENQKGELKGAQAATDTALADVRKFVSDLDLASLSPRAVEAVAESEKAHGQLRALREQVAGGFGQADQIAAGYDAMISIDVDLPQRIGDTLSDRAIGRELAAYSALANVVELSSQEAEVAAAAIPNSFVTADTAVKLSSLQIAQTNAISTFRRNATQKQIDAVDTALFQPIDERSKFTAARSDVLGSVGETSPIKTRQSDWIKLSYARVSALQNQLEPLAADTARTASATAADARSTALLLLALGLGVVAVVIVLGVFLARAMTRPLRRLTATAGELADELPKMVERMATPGEGPGVQLPDLDVDSTDEVGQLAAAFRNVNETTVRVAEEQAALRASIAEMFVNVARRNHVLLSRQLSFIDQLERTEENPDTLDNLFRLDHLATRMRRNAESLIVLAGLDAGRRLRRPMPLSDVIRTAVSEIERYDRVDLALQADPPLVGHVALTTAHMIAELLENATQFSNPDTRVITATAFTSTSVRITITDLGLGMTWDEITEANQRIANPPVTDVVGSQRLGFYVVGRLARRLDATVALRPGRTQGTVVTIDLPPTLFVPGSVAEFPVVEVDAAGAPALEAAPADAAVVEAPAGAEAAADVPTDEPVAEPVAEASDAPVAEASDAPVAEVAEPSDDEPALPRRGQAQDAAARVEPRVPVLPAPPVPDGVSVPTDGADGGSLPKRVARDAEPVVAEPAPVEPAGPRGGIFSNFRARRTVDESEAAPVLPSQLAEHTTPLDDGTAEEFVPVLEQSTPALPTREAPVEAAAEPVAEPVAEVAEVTDVAEPVAEVAAEPVPVPGPLDAGWVPPAEAEVAALAAETAEVEAEVEALEQQVEAYAADAPAQPFADAEDDAPFVPSFEPSGEPVAERTVADAEPVAEPVAELEPVAQLEAVADLEPVAQLEPEASAPDEAEAEPVATPVHEFPPSPYQARAALSELAQDDAHDPEPEVEAGASAEPVAEPVVEEVTPVPALPPIGVPAMDILPTRGGRGRLGRRTGRAKPAPAPAVPVAPAPARPTRDVVAPAPVAPTAPAPEVTREPVPVAAAPAEQPQWAAPAPEPAAAPSSLFAPPPAAEPVASIPAQPAPSSLFAPPPAAAPEPVAAAPAFAAAASLRERSEMASQALSELSALSTYSPQAVQPAAPASLTRRTPLATEAGQMASQAATDEPIGARRGARNAADVRTMLSGFRAGVERGRTSPASTAHSTSSDEAGA